MLSNQTREQEEIVHLIHKRFEGIEREIDEALRPSEALRQAILKKAFTGRLVPQDPSDEPASTLLAGLREGKIPATSSRRELQPAPESEP